MAEFITCLVTIHGTAFPHAPLTHVALVYVGLEEPRPHLGALLESLAKSVWGAGKYASIPGLSTHDYWDDDGQLVRPLAELLRATAGR